MTSPMDERSYWELDKTQLSCSSIHTLENNDHTGRNLKASEFLSLKPPKTEWHRGCYENPTFHARGGVLGAHSGMQRAFRKLRWGLWLAWKSTFRKCTLENDH